MKLMWRPRPRHDSFHLRWRIRMAKPESDKRVAPRYPLKQDITVRVSDGKTQELEAETRDLSSGGIYFYMDSNLHEGSEIEIVAMLPPEITKAENSWVCCKARVVRVESPESGPRGV